MFFKYFFPCSVPFLIRGIKLKTICGWIQEFSMGGGHNHFLRRKAGASVSAKIREHAPVSEKIRGGAHRGAPLNPPLLYCIKAKKFTCFVTLLFSSGEHIYKSVSLKGPYADHILIPQGSTGSNTFFDIKWEPKFFYLQIQNFSFKFFCSFGGMTKFVKLNGIPENNFLCTFIITSSPGVHTFFCLWRVNKKLPQGETSQNTFHRSRSIN